MLNSPIKFKPTVQVFYQPNKIFIRSNGYFITIPDDNGVFKATFELLDGQHTVKAISEKLITQFPEASEENLTDVICDLDEQYLLEKSDTAPSKILTDYDLERWHRNLDFFNSYCRLSDNKYGAQAKIKQARILLLGLGGLGSHILYDLVALGATDIRAVDFDKIDLTNLNRQILYGEDNIGQLKTEAAEQRIKQFCSQLDVDFINHRISGAADIERLLEGREIVICVADKPKEHILNWLNEACTKQGIPFINGGLDTQRAVYCSVIPGQSGCIHCWKTCVEAKSGDSANLLQAESAADAAESQPAPAIVPLVSAITSFVVAEFVRIVTNIAKPVATNKLLSVDFDTMQVKPAEVWQRQIDCDYCGKGTHDAY